MKISERQLLEMKRIREAIGVKVNHFTKKEIEYLYLHFLIKQKRPYVSTGGFKFYLSKDGKSLMAKFNMPPKFRFTLAEEGESK